MSSIRDSANISLLKKEVYLLYLQRKQVPLFKLLSSIQRNQFESIDKFSIYKQFLLLLVKLLYRNSMYLDWNIIKRLKLQENLLRFSTHRLHNLCLWTLNMHDKKFYPFKGPIIPPILTIFINIKQQQEQCLMSLTMTWFSQGSNP